MKIGMTLPSMIAGLDRDTLLAWMQRIDQGPFTSLSVGERITYGNQEAMVTMSAAAAVTKRVELVFTVIVSPLHAEALLAKQLASLDVLSGGRITLGIGVGGREHDYRAAGRSFEKRFSTMTKQAKAIKDIWAGKPIAEGIDPIGPPPLQAGGPPIIVGAMQPGSIRKSSAWADGICGFSFGPGVDEVASACELLETSWTKNGRAGSPRKTMTCWFALGEGSRSGESQLDAYVRRYLAVFGEKAAASMAGLCEMTSAGALKERIGQLATTGLDELILVPTTADLDEISRVEDLIGG